MFLQINETSAMECDGDASEEDQAYGDQRRSPSLTPCSSIDL